jgi:hypothetical protein
LISLLFFILTACQNESSEHAVRIAKDISYTSSECSSSSLPSDGTVFIPQEDDLKDYMPWYDDMQDNVITIRVKTITQSGPCEIGDYRGCTLTDINNDINFSDEFKPEIKVHISAPDLIDEGLVSNATMRIKGKSTRQAAQKSYRIKLDSKTNLWRGQRYFQLSKHPYDTSRLRNKLSFDLFRGIDNFASLRIQFVHLYIDNIDYGLYSQTEHVDENYMINRNFDKSDNIFKAQKFTFNNNSALALDIYGHPVDKFAFDSLIELKNGKEYNKLIKMIDALNSRSNNFNDVFNKFFNRNNYLTWMAINILTDNIDTVSQNFYLYNPKGSEKFYFTPWDYDDGWGTQYQKLNIQDGEIVPDAQKGVCKWWEIPLHKNFLKDPYNVELLKRAVLEIKEKYFNEQIVNARIAKLKYLIKPYISSLPDIDKLYVVAEDYYQKINEWEDEVNDLYNRLNIAEKEFFESLIKPMPFWVSSYYKDNQLVIDWGESYSLTGKDIKYSILVANSPEFYENSVIVRISDFEDTTYYQSLHLDTGHYYVKVGAVDEDGNTQESFDVYYDGVSKMYPGVHELIVK